MAPQHEPPPPPPITVQSVVCHRKGATEEQVETIRAKVVEEVENAMKTVGLSFTHAQQRKAQVFQMMKGDLFQNDLGSEPETYDLRLAGDANNSGIAFIDRTPDAVLTAEWLSDKGKVSATKNSLSTGRTRALASNTKEFKIGSQYFLDCVLRDPESPSGAVTTRTMVGVLTGFVVLLQFDANATFTLKKEQVFAQTNAYRIDGLFCNDLGMTIKTLRMWKRKDATVAYELGAAQTDLSDCYPLTGNEDLFQSWLSNSDGGADLLPSANLTLAVGAVDMFLSEMLVGCFEQLNMEADWITSIDQMFAVDGEYLLTSLSAVGKDLNVASEDFVPTHLYVSQTDSMASWKELYKKLSRPFTPNFDDLVDEADTRKKRQPRSDHKASSGETASQARAGHSKRQREQDKNMIDDGTDSDDDGAGSKKKAKAAAGWVFNTLTDAAVAQKLQNKLKVDENKGAELAKALKVLKDNNFKLSHSPGQRKVESLLMKLRTDLTDKKAFPDALESLYAELGVPPPASPPTTLEQNTGDLLDATPPSVTTVRLVGEGLGGKEPKKRPDKASTKAPDNNEAPVLNVFDNARANALSAQLEALRLETKGFNDNKKSHYEFIEEAAKQAVDEIRELKNGLKDATASSGTASVPTIVLPQELSAQITEALKITEKNAALSAQNSTLIQRCTALTNFMGFAIDTFEKGLNFVVCMKPQIANGTFTLEEVQAMVRNCIQIQHVDGRSRLTLIEMLGAA